MGMRMGRQRDGPLIVRLEGGGELAASLAERAAEFGLRLATDGERADMVARLPPVDPVDDREALRYSLSGRELEILEYLVDGWSNAEIASVLGIAVRTVRFHLEGLYSKLGVTRRGEAAREALARGLVRFDA
jgi:DNA-binding CsgD family transcriptional regulator